MAPRRVPPRAWQKFSVRYGIGLRRDQEYLLVAVYAHVHGARQLINPLLFKVHAKFICLMCGNDEALAL